jgi:hypothetical protein
MTPDPTRLDQWVESTDVLVRLWIPLLPGKALSPNEHPHWGDVSAARREMRETVGLIASQAKRQWQRGRVGVELVHGRRNVRDGRYRPKDITNLISALKPLYDGLVDGQLLPDDTADHLQPGEHRITYDPKHGRGEGLYVRIDRI